jgi:hypothetical protein
MKKALFFSAVAVMAMWGGVFAPGVSAAALSASELACVRTAVEKRENGIIAAHTAFGSAVGSALQTRKSALVSAWGIEDRKARNTARYEAWRAFKDAVSLARKTHRTAVGGVWDAYRGEAKACNVSVEGVEPRSVDDVRF